MRTASFVSSRSTRRFLSTFAGIVLVAGAVACGGGSDTTGPGGGGSGVGSGGGGGGGGGGTTTPPVATVTVTPPSATLLTGVTDSASLGTTTISATLKDAGGNVLSGRTVTWSSSATNVATVSTAGVVTAVGAGSATITATSESQTGNVSVTVTRPAVSTIVLAPTSATLLTGVVDSTTLGSTALTATPMDASRHALSGRTVTWTSSAPTVATVSSTGAVKAVGAGSATITASAEGQSGSAPITVTRPAIATLTIAPQTSSIAVGATETLVVTPVDAQQHVLTGRIITVTNNSASVISVNGGQVTGVSAGTGSVTYASEGAQATATITVTP
ncbi:MAG: Ig-like domain-containing protein [Gemmatimonadaceae bacterium]